MATARRAISACSRSTILPSTCSAPLPCGLGRVERGDDRARPRDLLLGRREDVVAGGDLVGVDQRLAVEAEVAAPAWHSRLKPSSSGECIVDAVERYRAHWRGRRRGRSSARAASAPGPAAQRARGVLRQIVGAHHEAGEPGRGSRAASAISSAASMARGVSIIAHTRVASGVPASSSTRPTRTRSAGVRHLGHQDGVGRGLGRGVEVVRAPRRVEAVDADEHLAQAVAAGLDRGRTPACGRPPWRRAPPRLRGRGSGSRPAGCGPFPGRGRWSPACRARCGADGGTWPWRMVPVGLMGRWTLAAPVAIASPP